MDSIKIDLPRTFPDNIYFENHNIRYQLFNVLVAYAHHNKEVGYCQGLNYIAGLILIITKNEEWTFWLLKVLLDNIVRSYHTKTMDGLKVDTAVLRELLILRVPDVNKRLEDFGRKFHKNIRRNSCCYLFLLVCRSSVCCDIHKMVNLSICWSASHRNCLTNLGLCVQRRIQGNTKPSHSFR